MVVNILAVPLCTFANTLLARKGGHRRVMSQLCCYHNFIITLLLLSLGAKANASQKVPQLFLLTRCVYGRALTSAYRKTKKVSYINSEQHVLGPVSAEDASRPFPHHLPTGCKTAGPPDAEAARRRRKLHKVVHVYIRAR